MGKCNQGGDDGKESGEEEDIAEEERAEEFEEGAGEGARNPRKVRHLIADKVEPMVKANTEEALKGQLSQLKYLFEVLGVYPEPAAPGGDRTRG